MNWLRIPSFLMLFVVTTTCFASPKNPDRMERAEKVLDELLEMPEGARNIAIREKARELAAWQHSRETPRDQALVQIGEPLPPQLTDFSNALVLAAELARKEKRFQRGEAFVETLGPSLGVSGMVVFVAMLAASLHLDINFLHLILGLAGGSVALSGGVAAISGDENSDFRLLLKEAENEFRNFSGKALPCEYILGELKP